jgi:hypothetical protein
MRFKVSKVLFNSLNKQIYKLTSYYVTKIVVLDLALHKNIVNKLQSQIPSLKILIKIKLELHKINV